MAFNALVDSLQIGRYSIAKKQKFRRAALSGDRKPVDHKPVDLLAFTAILDDIVLPDGASSMGRLGGGGPQTLWGFQLQRMQTARVALAAGVGADFPQHCMDWLAECSIDTEALLPCESMTPRAWQILEEDGRRHEMWRTPFNDQLVSMLRPRLDQLPPAYQTAKSYHVGVHPQDPSLPLLREIGQAARSQQGTAGLVSAETFVAATAALPAAALEAFMCELDVFSPNEREASSMLFGPSPELPASLSRCTPRLLTQPFLDAGAGLVALRCGEHGAVVHTASGEAWCVPAYPGTAVLDPTGCGNAFIGALLGALLEGEGLAAAAAWGCAAGSLMAESWGTPTHPPRQLAVEARRRQEAVLDLAALV